MRAQSPTQPPGSLSLGGLFLRLAACLLLGAPLGFLVYRWFHRVTEGHADWGETLLALLALVLLLAVLRYASRSLARAP